MSDHLTTIRTLIRSFGEDPEREGLQETPQRYLKAWSTWCSGYGQDPAAILKTFADGAEGYDTMVLQERIPFWSNCEHHLAPFFGQVHIGYMPKGRIVGLSKLARLVEVFARRLTVQERLGVQIADALQQHLQPLGCGVIVQARHSCMESRGIQKSGTITTTSALRGCFLDPAMRQEFLGLVAQSQRGDLI